MAQPQGQSVRSPRQDVVEPVIDGDFLDAVDYGRIDEARELLAEGADVNARDALSGASALHLAVAGNDLRLVKLLREEWAAAIQEDNFGRTPSVLAGADYVTADLKGYIFAEECRNYLDLLEQLNGPVENWPAPNAPRRYPDIRSPYLCA